MVNLIVISSSSKQVDVNLSVHVDMKVEVCFENG